MSVYTLFKLLLLFSLKSVVLSLLSVSESVTSWGCSTQRPWAGQPLHKGCIQVWAGRNAGTRQLSKECSLGRNSLAENEGENWIQNVELACSCKVIRRAGCSTCAAGCIFWVLSVCRPSYSHGPDQCFDAAQSGCLLLLTAEVCDLKCILSRECKGFFGVLKLCCCRRADFLELPCSRSSAAVLSSSWKCCTGKPIMWRSDLPEILRGWLAGWLVGWLVFPLSTQ